MIESVKISLMKTFYSILWYNKIGIFVLTGLIGKWILLFTLCMKKGIHPAMSYIISSAIIMLLFFGYATRESHPQENESG